MFTVFANYSLQTEKYLNRILNCLLIMTQKTLVPVVRHPYQLSCLNLTTNGGHMCLMRLQSWLN